MSDSEPERQVPPGSSWVCTGVDVEWHEDWAAFRSYIDAYEAATHQIFRQRTSTSVQKRNREIEATQRQSKSSLVAATTDRRIPEEFKNFWIKLVCTHGWNRKSRGKGIRKAFFDKSTGCKANIKAAVVWNDTENKFMVRVTDFDVSHNHNVSKAIFENHVSNRRVDDPTLLAFVDELQAAGSKPKLIMQYLRKKTGKNVTLRDVHNMVAKLKENRRGGATTEDRLEAVLRNVCEGRGNRATVFVDEEKMAQTITLQTRQMRRWFKAFPEVMLVDATHNTNESRYKLFSFMVNDVYGHGQYVHHSLMENESAECLTDAISSFKTHNPSWDQVKVIVIDKDMGELGLLEKSFPGVKVILCHFHLKKYIRTEMTKSEYGGPSSFDKTLVEDAVDLMRLATSLEEYTKYLKYLYFLLDGVHLREADDIPDPKHPFLCYFMKNWDSMKERWSLYARSDVPHLGNHTNNRLETSWGHIKEVLKPEMALDECVHTLMFLQAVAEMEYAKKITDVGQMRYDGADSELQKLACEVSPYAYRLVEQQYWLAKDRTTNYNQQEIQPSLFVLSGGKTSTATYHVDTARYRCSCVFMKTMLLPCRHVMYWRLMQGKTAIPVRHIEPRWKLTWKLNQPAAEEEVSSKNVACTTFQVRESSMTAREHQVLNGSTKYKHAVERGKNIADIMSRNGTLVFREMMAALDKFEDIVKDGVSPFVGREGPWIDPLSLTQLSQIELSASTDVPMETGTEMRDSAQEAAEEKAKNELGVGSDDALPLTQLSPTKMCHARKLQAEEVSIDTDPVHGSTSLVPGDTGATDQVPEATDQVPGGIDQVPGGTDNVTGGTEQLPAVTLLIDSTKPASSIVGHSDRSLSASPEDMNGSKRRLHTSSSSSESSQLSQTGGFTLVKSTSNRGRPRVRKKQVLAEKKRRISGGKQTAKRLVQGTLTPVPSLRNLVKVLDNDYSYDEAKRILPTLPIRAVPKSKKAIAGVFDPAKCNSDVRFVFPLLFVEKAKTAIMMFRKTLDNEGSKKDVGDGAVLGVQVSRFGIFEHQDIVAMDRWHTSTKYLSETEDAMTWATNTNHKHLSVPEELSDGVNFDPAERERAIKALLLRGGRDTPFGNVPFHSLLKFRRMVWLDDNCMSHGIALLQREHPNVGVINPIFMRFGEKELQYKAMIAGNPFQDTNDLILVPLHVENNHWCGAVFDLRRQSRGITIFDPLQASKSKYYDECEAQLKSLLGPLCELLVTKRATHSKQPDMASCGVMVLTFFECYVKGIAMPDKPTQSLIRFLRLRYMLKCLP